MKKTARFISLTLAIVFICIAGGVYFSLKSTPSSIEDNPAILLNVELKNGKFRIKSNGRIYDSTLSKLSQCSEYQNQLIAKNLQEIFHGRFSAYLNSLNEIEIIVEDVETSKEISFNLYMEQILGENCKPDSKLVK